MDSSLMTHRLAHLVPCSDSFKIDHASDLVLNALMLSSTPQTAVSLVGIITEQLGCAMSQDHVADKLKELDERQLVLLVKGGYILSAQVQDSLKQKQAAFSIQYDSIIQQWISSIARQYGVLTPEDAALLTEDLWEYLNSLFLTHGAESLSFVTDTGSAPPIAVDQVSVPAECRPESRHLMDVERLEFAKFLGSSDPDILRFLLELIDRAIRYLSTVVDPDVLATLKGQLRGKLLFLDSSTVYRLANLQGQHRYEVMVSVAALCREAGFDLRVNRKTLDELRRRLKWDAGTLRKYPVPVILGAVGVHYLTDENYVSSYWRAAKDHGMAVEDFISHFNHIDDLLADMGVTVEKEERVLPPDAQEAAKYWASQLGQYEDPDSEYKRGPASLEHDGYNIALIDVLAKDAQHFIDTPAWFLTADQTLARLQRKHYQRRDKLPFCIMPSQIIQILRFTTASDGAYDRAFLGLFSRAFVPSGLGIPNEMIQEILARIAKYKGTPTLAKSVLSDSYFIRRYSATQDEGEKDELVHDAVVAKAKETEEALEHHRARLASAEQQTAQLQETVSRLSTASDRAEDLLESQQRDFAAKEEELKSKLAEAQRMLEEAAAALKAAEARDRRRDEQERENRERRRRLWQGSAILASALVPLTATWLFVGWSDLTKGWKALVLTLPVLGMTAAAYRVCERTVGVIVLAVISLVFTVFAALYACL